jgi:3-deoxy-manno-octulosonate cytidylyltransferase (CMP-KDO synthetase)
MRIRNQPFAPHPQQVEISVCPGSGNPYKRPDFPPIPIISGLFCWPADLVPDDRNPHSGADSRPHGGDPPARQAAARHRRPADDRPRAAAGEEAKIGRVAVATDTPEIAAAVKAAGGEVVMTRADHPSGSDRIHEAMRTIDPDGRAEIVVNLQGDFPTITPDTIRAALPPLDDPAVDIATLASQIHTEEEDLAPSVVKAVGSPIGREPAACALFHPRHGAPWRRPRYHHIGLYAYRRAALERFVALPPSPLEQQEKLEQLRALEAGMRIDITIVDSVPRGVDTPADLETAREYWQKLSLKRRRQEDDMTKKLKIAFQGEPGANSHIAIVEAYPDAEPLPCATFEDALARSPRRGRSRHDPDREFGRRPGRRHPSSAAGLRPVHRRRMVSADPHQLMAVRGAKLTDIKTVESHVHALGQCRASSASSASSRSSRPTPPAARATFPNARTRALPRSPRLAAQIYGLDILAEDVEDEAHNTTRFVVLAREQKWADRDRGRWSPLLFSGCATCPPRSTRRSAALPPTAST